MSKNFEHFLHEKLEHQFQKGLKRNLTHVAAGSIDFTSNDYIGLARSEELFGLIDDKVHEIGRSNGSTGSRLLSGNSTYTEEVEARLSKIFQCDATLLFNSGYTANLAVLSSLPQKNDTIIYDELAHACIKDGARLSLAKRFSFKHNDLDDLRKKISQSQGRIFIAVESIYSMDGDECPLRELVKLKDGDERITIIVDEAHSTGVVGAGGSGLVTTLGLEASIDVRIHTFGKAMGCHGACVAGASALKDYLVNFARPFIYTTASSVHHVASIDCSFRYLAKHIHLQKDLQKIIAVYIRLSEHIISKTKSKSAIQTIIIPGNENVRATARALQASHFDVRPIVSPTVPKGLERLRICLHTYNTAEEIESLCSHLRKLNPLEIH